MVSKVTHLNLGDLESVLSGDQLDGGQGLSTQEELALRYVADQYENVLGDIQDATDLASRSSLVGHMTDNLRIFYEGLNSAPRGPQIIFLDLGPAKEAYAQKGLKEKLKMAFEDWQTSFLNALRSHFILPNGEKLNIEFTTQKPKSKEPFTTVVVTPQLYKEFMDADETRQAMAARGELYQSAPNQEKIAQEVALIKKRLGIQEKNNDDLTDEEWRQIARDPRLQAFVDKGEKLYGRYVSQSASEFGNPKKDDLVWMGIEIFVRNYDEAAAILTQLGGYDNFLGQISEGRENDPTATLGTYRPWIAVSDGKSFADIIAETTAHEIGHALGLAHPSSSYLEFKNDWTVDIMLNRTGHLMEQASFRERIRPETPRFNEFAFDYLKYILGVDGRAPPIDLIAIDELPEKEHLGATYLDYQDSHPASHGDGYLNPEQLESLQEGMRKFKGR